MSYIDQKDVQKFNGGSAFGAPSYSGGTVEPVFNSSGWSVAFDNAKANATAENTDAQGLSVPPWLIAVAVVMLVVGWVKTSR